ncbi:MAG: T9SS type A sorting domain-containing protein [Melioribacteraceae bacterium]|nr:T9SS type A sorting domain-containing protein [Melioribacteraceae bacterium]
MKTQKITLAISFVVVTAFAMLLTSNWMVDDVNNFTKEKKEGYSKVTKTKVGAVGTENWSQKKQRVKGTAKFDAPDKFAELHAKIRTAPGETKPGYERNYRFIELAKAKTAVSLMKNSIDNVTDILNWVERGPANVGGRTRALVIDPDDATYGTWFAGAVGGGVWKTTDAGTSWIPLTDDLPNLAVSSLEMAASNRNVLYAGTGEGFYNADAIEGNGIMKTTDRGDTWVQLASTATDPDFAYVNRLAIDPTNENIVIAATNTGIFKTTDGGTTWSQVHSPGRIQDMRANPENFNTLFAATSQGVIRSFDAGDTWVLPNKAKFGGGRIEIAPAKSDTNRLYASVNSSPNKMYATSDGGTSWNEVEEVDGSDKNWLGGQGWYDNTIGVHPYNEDIVYMGGIDLWKSEIVIDSVLGITNITDTNLDTIFTYNPSGLPERDGGIGTGKDYFNENVLNSDYVDIEVRFGPGKSQKAHRYINNSFMYKDYVDVPFEVWDITNNKQLMCSFKDIDKNGVYNLRTSRGDIIFVNNVDYDPNNPSANMALNNGVKYENLFVVALRMLPGKVWDDTSIDELTVAIEVGKLASFTRSTVAITDGYGQYPTSTYTHVDHHNITMFTTNEATEEFIFLNGNDGGVAVSYDAGASFTEVGNNGYNTSQFYGVDKKPGGSQYYGGMQDNGTWESAKDVDADKTTEYIFRIGGDGFEVSWHYTDPQKMIGGSQFNRFWKTTNGGFSYFAANTGFNGWGNSAVSPFISKIAKSYSDPDLLYTITTEGVYRSEDFGSNWSLYPISAFAAAGYFSFAQVAISIAEPQVVWAGAASNGLFVSKDGGLSFEKVSDNTFISGARLSGLDTHPTDEATAYATFSFSGTPKVLRTTNYGASWEDISGYGSGSVSANGFPNVATYCVSVMPYNTDIIWAGTDIGIIESTDGGTSWHLAENGLPQVAIWEIRVVDDEVIVATHGRGIWSVSLPELAGHKPPEVTLAPAIISANQGVSGLILNASLRSVYDSTHVMINNQNVLTIKTSNIVDSIIVVPLSGTGNKTVYLNSFSGTRNYKSSSYDINLVELLETKQGYVNEFASDDGEFVLDGMSITGFSGGSLNSPHDYPHLQTSIALLRVPVIVASSNATLEYEDIAIIEKGEAGTVFGDSEFWDYVIVEASNGGEWIPLEDGYDARLHSDWLTAYDAKQSGTSSMYKLHSINLLDKFSAGDTLLIRFRLYADEFVNGWGWAIDNLIIQGRFVSVDDETILPKKFELSQNYPNPFNPSTVINYSLPTESKVKLQIFNTLGEEITTLVDETNNAGVHKIEWNASNLASGVYLYRISTESTSDATKFIAVKKMLLLK